MTSVDNDYATAHFDILLLVTCILLDVVVLLVGLTLGMTTRSWRRGAEAQSRVPRQQLARKLLFLLLQSALIEAILGQYILAKVRQLDTRLRL